MVKPLAIVGLLIVAIVAAPFSPASTDPIEAACADTYLWLSGVVPLDFLEFTCTVYDTGSPVNSELGNEDEFFEQSPDTQAYGETIQENGLPEETKQLLLFLLILWSQG